MTYTDSFVPQGSNPASNSSGPAVTLGAGVQLRELYNFAGSKNVSVVAGFASTVGAAGGYIQGGGHGPLSLWKGLGADNALEFNVVTANVRIHFIVKFN